MHNETDATVIERDQPVTKRRKEFTVVPFFIAMGIILVLTVLGLAIVSGTKWKKHTGVMAATYAARPSARELLGLEPVKAPPKLNHVVFRLDDEEIFRFVYEDGGDGRRYSFEMREGGS